MEKLTALVAAKYASVRNWTNAGLRAPYTEAQITNAGKEIGARDPEILAVLFAQSDAEPELIKTARPEFAGVGVLPR